MPCVYSKLFEDNEALSQLPITSCSCQPAEASQDIEFTAHLADRPEDLNVGDHREIKY